MCVLVSLKYILRQIVVFVVVFVARGGDEEQTPLLSPHYMLNLCTDYDYRFRIRIIPATRSTGFYIYHVPNSFTEIH